MGSDKGQGLRRRKLCEDVTGDRERKCSKVQVQEPALRQIQSKEAVVSWTLGRGWWGKVGEMGEVWVEGFCKGQVSSAGG